MAVAASALIASCTNNNPVAPQQAAAPQNHPMGAAAVDQNRLLNADREPGSWLAAGRDYNEQRFST